MSTQIPLTVAKARLSEIVRTVRRTRDGVTITVDGEPAARIVPTEEGPREMTPHETSTARALFHALARFTRSSEPFDAVDLVREGRR